MSAQPGAAQGPGDPRPLDSVDGNLLASALRAGIRRVAASQEHLNRINVFPVPDGDTGTNLTLTVSAILGALQAPEPHAGLLLARAAEAAIDGARGNSGAILAQFFVGWSEATRNLATLDASPFASAMHSGATSARQSLSEPREGTLLTVITDFATALHALVHEEGVRDFTQLLPLALERARISLDQTRYQLEALRRANVVDAGAQGFVELLAGFSDLLAGVEEATGAVEIAVPVGEAPAGDPLDITHRFCTECVITGTNIDRNKLREALTAMGSSVVLAGIAEKAKLHVHTDDPAAVFRLASGFGQVSARKADDIRKQQQAAHHAHSTGVAVVVDSAADIPADVLDRLGIQVVSLRVHFGERSYLDKVSLTQEEFYRELATNPQHPKTSQPPPGDFRRTFEFLASHYDTVISINVTAKVSGTLAAAESAAARVQGRGRVTVIDSLNASVGQGLIAMYAAECAAAGYSGEQVIARVSAIVPRTRSFALAGRLDFAVRGGRVPPIVKTVADLLRLTPVLMTLEDGRVRTATALFGRKRLRTRFARLVRRRMDSRKQYRVAVGHAQAQEEGQRLLDEICEGLGNIESRYLTPLGTALGVHGGPGMLLAAIQEYSPPLWRQSDWPRTP